MRSTGRPGWGNLAHVDDWRGEADVLVDRVLEVAPSTAVTRDQPTDRILIITLHSSVKGAADLHLVVSEQALILNAGTAFTSTWARSQVPETRQSK
jgi:hypothetical protein